MPGQSATSSPCRTQRLRRCSCHVVLSDMANCHPTQVFATVEADTRTISNSHPLQPTASQETFIKDAVLHQALRLTHGVGSVFDRLGGLARRSGDAPDTQQATEAQQDPLASTPAGAPSQQHEQQQEEQHQEPGDSATGSTHAGEHSGEADSSVHEADGQQPDNDTVVRLPMQFCIQIQHNTPALHGCWQGERMRAVVLDAVSLACHSKHRR